MGSRLHEAALVGDVATLLELLKEDDLVLDRITAECSEQLVNPLHIAALHGHVDFAREVLSRRPEFACKFNSKGFSPLHLASAKGHLEMVKELLKIDSSMCLAIERDGWIPLHLAARNGRVEVLKELVVAKPVSTVVLSESGETAIHLCVKHKHFDALKLLVELVGDAGVVNMKDAEDNTILHLAAATNQIKMFEYLVASSQVEVNSLNINGMTALDMLPNSQVEVNSLNTNGMTASDMPLQASDEQTHKRPEQILEQVKAMSGKENHPPQEQQEDKKKWLAETRSTILVVAVLIATATFQAGLNPPGGFWQENKPNGTDSHVAGQSVLSTQAPIMYRLFMYINSLGFLASQLIILLLISGFQFHRKSVMWVFTVVMWVAVSSMGATYTYGMLFIPDVDGPSSTPSAFLIVFFGWVAALPLLFTGHLSRLALHHFKNSRILKNKSWWRHPINKRIRASP